MNESVNWPYRNWKETRGGVHKSGNAPTINTANENETNKKVRASMRKNDASAYDECNGDAGILIRGAAQTRHTCPPAGVLQGQPGDKDNS